MNVPRLVRSLGILVVLAGGLLVAAGQLAGGGSQPATIDVAGRVYDIAFSRHLVLNRGETVPYSSARPSIPFTTEDETVYSIIGSDPRLVLVMRLSPGQSDDVGAIGEWVVFVRGGGLSELCSRIPEGLDASCPSD